MAANGPPDVFSGGIAKHGAARREDATGGKDAARRGFAAGVEGASRKAAGTARGLPPRSDRAPATTTFSDTRGASLNSATLDGLVNALRAYK